MAKDSNLLLRKFNDDECDDECPFFTCEKFKTISCDLYDVELQKGRYDYDNEDYCFQRCKKCSSDVPPNPNDKVVKLLQSIDEKLNRILNKM